LRVSQVSPAKLVAISEQEQGRDLLAEEVLCACVCVCFACSHAECIQRERVCVWGGGGGGGWGGESTTLTMYAVQAVRSWKSVGRVEDSGSRYMGAMVGTSARLFPDAEWDVGSQTLVIRCCAHVRQGQVTS
jgi:hypothetical protein